MLFMLPIEEGLKAVFNVPAIIDSQWTFTGLTYMGMS